MFSTSDWSDDVPVTYMFAFYSLIRRCTAFADMLKMHSRCRSRCRQTVHHQKLICPWDVQMFMFTYLLNEWMKWMDTTCLFGDDCQPLLWRMSESWLLRLWIYLQGRWCQQRRRRKCICTHVWSWNLCMETFDQSYRLTVICESYSGEWYGMMDYLSLNSCWQVSVIGHTSL